MNLAELKVSLRTFTFRGGISNLLGRVKEGCEGESGCFQLRFQFRASTQKLLVEWQLALVIINSFLGGMKYSGVKL